jgi:hypothetical protein
MQSRTSGPATANLHQRLAAAVTQALLLPQLRSFVDSLWLQCQHITLARCWRAHTAEHVGCLTHNWGSVAAAFAAHWQTHCVPYR